MNAQQVVRTLLEDHYEDDPDSRPGGPTDPYRQTTFPTDTSQFDYSGKRLEIPDWVTSNEMTPEEWERLKSEIEKSQSKDPTSKKHHPRFKLKFESTEALDIVQKPRTVYDDYCPHCHDQIHEKGLFFESKTNTWKHRNCGKPIKLPETDWSQVSPQWQFLKDL